MLPGFVTEPVAEPVTSEPVIDNATEKPVEKFQVGFYLDENGKVDWERMRGKTKEQLREIFEGADLSPILGTQSNVIATTNAPAEIDKDVAKLIIEAESFVAGVVVSQIYKIPTPITSHAFKYTDAQKELLADPLGRIVAKYCTKYKIDFLKEYRDEIMVCGILTVITRQKIAYAQEMQKAAMRPKVVTQPVQEKETEPQPEQVQ